MNSRTQSLECPLVLPPNVLFFLTAEIILNVEDLANLLRCLSLYHVSNCLASQVQQALHVQIVGSKDEAEEVLQDLGHDLAGNGGDRDLAQSSSIMCLIVCNSAATASFTSNASPSELINIIFLEVDAIDTQSYIRQ
ncbi:hypothetical protein QQP08_015908 [Theobroma cacao]|nr:hypothetical protein QQP08_015908 [Theobroma cacao]